MENVYRKENVEPFVSTRKCIHKENVDRTDALVTASHWSLPGLAIPATLPPASKQEWLQLG